MGSDARKTDNEGFRMRPGGTNERENNDAWKLKNERRTFASEKESNSCVFKKMWNSAG